MKLRALLLLAFLVVTCGVHAQKKNVDAARRLVGKTESLGEARKLIKEAMTNPQTATQARTWYVAGMVEWRSYESDVRKREINPKDGSVTDEGMNSKLLDGYRYFSKALSLDSVPDSKGRVKPRYSKEIREMLDAHSYDLYRAGALSYQAGKYYPQAYEGLMAAAGLASDSTMRYARMSMPDSARANTYFFAALSAYGGRQPMKALQALRLAEKTGMQTDTLYLYSMAIWEQLARDSIHLQPEAQDSLLAISNRAYRLHGIKVPDFLSRMTQLYIVAGQTDSILKVLNMEMERSPEEWLPRGLRAWVYESMGRMSDAVTDYKLAAEHPEMSAKMLIRGAHALYRYAHSRREEVKGTLQQRRKKALELTEGYLLPAQKMAQRAQEKTTDSKDLELISNILDAIDYDISVLK